MTRAQAISAYLAVRKAHFLKQLDTMNKIAKWNEQRDIRWNQKSLGLATTQLAHTFAKLFALNFKKVFVHYATYKPSQTTSPRSRRRQAILILRNSGWSLAQVGYLLRMSRERVRQVQNRRLKGLLRSGRRRYRCRKCGKPKLGHKCRGKRT